MRKSTCRGNSCFLVGDFQGETGPGIANRSLLLNLQRYSKYKISFTKRKKIIDRVYELIYGIFHNQVILICSKSNQNYLVICLSKILSRKIIYLMHGYSTYEYLLNNANKKSRQYYKQVMYEKFVLKYSDRIVCVSSFFANKLKMDYRRYSNKITFCYNSLLEINLSTKQVEKNDSIIKICSFGDVGNRKRNLSVCNAIKELVDSGYNIEYYVVGANDKKNYNFDDYRYIKFIDKIAHNDIYDFFADKTIYIQNSIFETFCLSVLEALHSNLSILAGKDFGCWDVMDNAKKSDKIEDFNDVEEIKRKIILLINEPNRDRLFYGIDQEKINGTSQVKTIEQIIDSLDVRI